MGISCEPEWFILLSELDDVYADKALIVTAVADTVGVWLDVFRGLLDDSSNEQWSDELLDKVMEKSNALKVTVEVLEGKTDISTYWSESISNFVLLLPKARVEPHQDLVAISLREEFLNCFQQRNQALVAGDGWDDLGTGRLVPDIALPDPRQEQMPDPETLSSPAVLTQKPPYHVLVTELERSRRILIESSHNPTLQFLAKYLGRWRKVHNAHTDKAGPLALYNAQHLTCRRRRV